MSDAPVTSWIGSPFFNSRGAVRPEAIVLHIAEGSLAGVDSWFNDPRAQVSAHFCVGYYGDIHQYVALPQAAWANGRIESGATAALIKENGSINPNLWSISIEHEGKSGEEPTVAQFEASAQLSAWLFGVMAYTAVTGLAVDRKHILRHGDISPVTRPNCPGWSEVTLARYIKRVQQLTAPPAAVDVEAIKARLHEALKLLGE